MLIFTQELIVGNPQCIEITETMKEADKYLQAGDYINAKAKANEALNSCKEAISQVSMPRVAISNFIAGIKSLKYSLYLTLAITLSIIIGLIYYLIKKRKIEKFQVQAEESEQDKV